MFKEGQLNIFDNDEKKRGGKRKNRIFVPKGYVGTDPIEEKELRDYEIREADKIMREGGSMQRNKPKLGTISGRVKEMGMAKETVDALFDEDVHNGLGNTKKY